MRGVVAKVWVGLLILRFFALHYIVAFIPALFYFLLPCVVVLCQKLCTLMSLFLTV